MIDGTTRRQLLKTMSTATFLALGGGVLSACSRSGGASGADVVLTVAGGVAGFDAMPTAKEQKANPSTKAYADALSAWLKDNPGVRTKQVSLNVWDQQALSTAITGGTAPAAFPADVVSAWNQAQLAAASKQGLFADVTDQLKAHKVEENLTDYAKPIFMRKKVGDRFFVAPRVYNVGTGIHYRLDLIRQAGLKEPTPDWTWDDVRELARGLTTESRKGMVLQGSGVNGPMNADGMDFHAHVPAPETGWNWRWDYLGQADRWIPLIQGARDMIFKDQSILSDVSMTDTDARAAFVRGDVAMQHNTVVYYDVPPGTEDAPTDLAKKLGKPIWDVVGWTTEPVGRNGRGSATQGQVDTVGFSPDLAGEALDKSVSLLAYMQTEGWVRQRTAVYEATKDPQRVFVQEDITPVYKGLLEKLPSSPDEAWGEPFMDQVRRAAQIPLVPSDVWFFPAEANQGPTTTVRDDMTSRWANERGDIDLRADLTNLGATLNKQAASFTSSTGDDEFVKNALAFYEANAEYWQENAPEYYQNVFRDWYEDTVMPALK
uniref:Extracellular solute-binding protein n=1 Tax=Actinopolymorpha pittospori TaxID=648752 RepID=A0A927RKS8_9ACTN|nr:ABC transporter substrate-binding protein [Actinopolymorpha pittospori]MBE1608536.1 hypothetical protein [Actinopolymorpha pittospori]